MSEQSEPESPVEAENAPTVEGGVEDVREAAEGLRRLFSTLVPPDEVEIEDAFGGRYTVRAVLPARRQIVVMRKIEGLLSVDAEIGALATAGAGVEGIASAIVSLASNEVVLDGVAGAFEAAHPSVVEQARARARDAGVSEEESTHPADLFSIEELVGGLLPFFLRLAAKIVGILGTAIGATSEAA